MAEKSVIRVLIADDHNVVREGIAGFLRAFDDFSLIGEASNGKEAVMLVGDLQPDVVLMDLVMPMMDGVAATQAIRQSYPATQVIILTSFHDEDSVQKGLQAGAIGYLLKNASIHDMANAIRAAHQGKATLAPEAAQALISAHTRPPAPNFN
ncbi:partial Transcriptional regulatory protein LiaR, partial [Anaerolineae bacterium]